MNSRAKADNLKLMTAVLNDPPYKSENEETKLKYVMLVNEYLKKIQIEKVDSELLSNLSKDNLVKLYDYLNKTFEFLSDLKDVKDGIIIIILKCNSKNIYKEKIFSK